MRQQASPRYPGEAVTGVKNVTGGYTVVDIARSPRQVEERPVAVGITRVRMLRTAIAASCAVAALTVAGLPVAAWLAFPLGLGAPGVWWGLAAGLFVACGTLGPRLWLRVRRDSSSA